MVEVLQFSELREQTLQMLDRDGVVQIAHVDLLLLVLHFGSSSWNERIRAEFASKSTKFRADQNG